MRVDGPVSQEHVRSTVVAILTVRILLRSVLSMTLGRPGMISISLAATVPLPLEIDDDFLDTQSEGFSVRSDGLPCRISFYIHQLHFYGIINDILQTFYQTGSEQHQEADSIAKALRLESSLMAWNRNLPQFLRESSLVHEKNTFLQRLAIINKVR